MQWFSTMLVSLKRDVSASPALDWSLPIQEMNASKQGRLCASTRAATQRRATSVSSPSSIRKSPTTTAPLWMYTSPGAPLTLMKPLKRSLPGVSACLIVLTWYQRCLACPLPLFHSLGCAMIQEPPSSRTTSLTGSPSTSPTTQMAQ